MTTLQREAMGPSSKEEQPYVDPAPKRHTGEKLLVVHLWALECPPCVAELPMLRAHATHLRQLFQNLIGNAIKYRSEDRTPTVHVGAARQDGYWVFAVRDNGIGIQPEFKEQIFGLFSRLHNADRYAGTGIGLAICQRIVERYHGRIWVESEPGRGSEFRFTLPV